MHQSVSRVTTAASWQYRTTLDETTERHARSTSAQLAGADIASWLLTATYEDKARYGGQQIATQNSPEDRDRNPTSRNELTAADNGETTLVFQAAITQICAYWFIDES